MIFLLLYCFNWSVLISFQDLTDTYTPQSIYDQTHIQRETEREMAGRGIQQRETGKMGGHRERDREGRQGDTEMERRQAGGHNRDREREGTWGDTTEKQGRQGDTTERDREGWGTQTGEG